MELNELQSEKNGIEVQHSVYDVEWSKWVITTGGRIAMISDYHCAITAVILALIQTEQNGFC